MAGQSDRLSALLHSDCIGPHSDWSVGIPFLRAVDWRGDQGGDEVICTPRHSDGCRLTSRPIKLPVSHHNIDAHPMLAPVSSRIDLH
jgi:hypothetical protein